MDKMAWIDDMWLKIGTNSKLSWKWSWTFKFYNRQHSGRHINL